MSKGDDATVKFVLDNLACSFVVKTLTVMLSEESSDWMTCKEGGRDLRSAHWLSVVGRSFTLTLCDNCRAALVRALDAVTR